MNNKGQTLVVFVLFIPLLFICIGMIIYLGMVHTEKNKIDSCLKNIVKSYIIEIDNTEKDELKNKIEKLIDINLNDIDYEINIDEDIKVTATKKIKFDSVFSKDTKYKVTIIGTKDGKIIIKRGEST